MASETEPPACPQCGCNRVFRDGLRYLANGDAVQRWLCRNCGYRFTKKRFNDSDGLKRNPRVYRQRLKSDFAIHSKRQVCDCLTRASKNLTAVEEPRKNGLAGATAEVLSQSQADVKGAIINFAWKLKREAYSDETIKEYCYILKSLVNVEQTFGTAKSLKT